MLGVLRVCLPIVFIEGRAQDFAGSRQDSAFTFALIIVCVITLHVILHVIGIGFHVGTGVLLIMFAREFCSWIKLLRR